MIRSEIIINNVKIDLFEDLPMSLNYLIADITEPDKRNSSFSKTIQIPGSKENNKLFTHIWDISKESLSDGTTNFTPDFNVNKKATCQVFVDTIGVFTGIVRLLEVVRVGNDIRYDVQITGQLANVFRSIGEKFLTDYDFSEFNHDLTKTNQKNSWDTSIIKDGAPLVNFSGTPETGFTNGPPSGEGYVYPLINYGFNEEKLGDVNIPTQKDTNFKVLHLYPAIYKRQYLETIFREEGFTWSSDFLDSDFFKKQIIPFNGEVVNLTTDQSDNRKFLCELTSSVTGNQTINFTSAEGGHLGRQVFISHTFDDDSTGPNFDNDGVYDTGTGVYTVNAKGEYSLETTVIANHTLDIPGTAANAIIRRTFEASIIKIEKATGQVSVLKTVFKEDFQSISSPPASHTTSNKEMTVVVPSVELESGDEIRVDLAVTTRAVFTNALGFKIKTGVNGAFKTLSTADAGTRSEFFNGVLSTTPSEGDEIVINSYIPKKVKARNFVNSVIKEFNLYVDVDKNNERNLLIEPAIDFYDNNETIDWSDKLDIESVKVKPSSEIKGKEYRFVHTEDKDFYNLLYTGRNEEVYGEETFEVDNDFVEGTKEFKVIFAPTPTVGNFENDMVIPKMYDLSDNGEPEPRISIIRSLQYGGVLSVGGSWAYLSELEGDTNETTYPYSGHLDHPFSPSSDLNWGVPNEVFWGSSDNIGGAYPTGNLFNTYWRIFIDEITDKDAKLVEAQFHLKPIDIFKLDFRNFIYVEGLDKQIFRLNKVKSYNPTRNGLTRVELTKVKNKDPFIAGFTTLGNALQDAVQFNILEGGLDEVRNIAAINPELIVEGGEDEVRDLSDTFAKFIVTGGRD